MKVFVKALSTLLSKKWAAFLLMGMLLAGTVVGCQISRTPSNAPAIQPYRIIGYVGGGTEIWRIDAAKLTHINYAFAKINEAGQIYFDNPRSYQHMAQLQALKSKNPHLKLLVSVGGWGADGFSDAALTDASRRVFAESIIEMIKQYDLDGIDLDWEYPGQPGPGIVYREEDKINFTLMLKTVREHLDRLSNARGHTGPDRYLLTIASNDDQAYFEHTEMETLHRYLDFINVMTYDTFTSGSSMTGHHTGLYGSDHPGAAKRNAATAIDRHLRAGIPPRKIVLGVAFYGRGWNGVNPENNGLNQPYGAFDGAYAYSKLQEEYIDKNGFDRYWDAMAKAPYLWNPTDSVFISYDDVESLRHKTVFVKEKGIGGVMYWQHRHDPEEELLGEIYEGLLPE